MALDMISPKTFGVKVGVCAMEAELKRITSSASKG